MQQTFQHFVGLWRWTPETQSFLLARQVTRQQARITRVGFRPLANAFAVVAQPISIHNVNPMPHFVGQFNRVQVVNAGGFQSN
ncbi:hypothetical protein D3C84_878880 [compost metagenome]